MTANAAKLTDPAFQAFSTEEIQNIRAEFETLRTPIHGKELIYFDNGATTLKPKSIISLKN